MNPRRSTVTCWFAGVLARRLAPPGGHERASTNLEILALVFVAVTRVPLQLSRVEET